MTVPAWVGVYRGKPFQRDADGPDAFDCYGLVRAVLRERHGVHAPPMDGAYHLDMLARLQRALDGPECPWEVFHGEPEPGDVLTFEDPSPRHELHVGIVVAAGWMLHARQGEGVATAWFDRAPWGMLRFGPAYRHRGLVSAAARPTG